MKAITEPQPGASLIALGVKTIITRPWPAPANLIGQPLAVHAGAQRLRTWYGHIDQDVPPWIDHVAMGWCWDWFENVNDYTQHAYRWCGPLGAVVATCRLAACVPIVELVPLPSDWPGACLDIVTSFLWSAAPGQPDHYLPTDIEDQLPYGDFAPGRWAWLLEDIEKLCAPVPARGRPRIWEWAP